MFRFIHSISEKRLTAPKIHLNTKNLQYNQDFEIIKWSTFKPKLHQFSEFQSILLNAKVENNVFSKVIYFRYLMS